MFSLTSVLTRYKYGINRVWFSLCSFGAVHASCLQDYENIYCILCTLTCLIAWKAEILSVSCSQQTLTKCLESYYPLSSLSTGHSYHQSSSQHQDQGEDWADALRVSSCTLPKRVRTEFTSKGAVGDQDLFDSGTNSTEFWLQSRIH